MEEVAKGCRNLLVVCHGGVVRTLLEHFLALTPARIILVGPASLTALRFSGEGAARLELFHFTPGQNSRHRTDFSSGRALDRLNHVSHRVGTNRVLELIRTVRTDTHTDMYYEDQGTASAWQSARKPSRQSRVTSPLVGPA